MIPPPDLDTYGFCPHCERRSRAAISRGKSGKVYIRYSATSRKRLKPEDVKVQHSVRWSENRERELKRRGYKSVQEFIDRG